MIHFHTPYRCFSKSPALLEDEIRLPQTEKIVIGGIKDDVFNGIYLPTYLQVVMIMATLQLSLQLHRFLQALKVKYFYFQDGRRFGELELLILTISNLTQAWQPLPLGAIFTRAILNAIEGRDFEASFDVSSSGSSEAYVPNN